MTSSTENIHKEFAKKTQEAKTNSHKEYILNNLTSAQKEGVKLLSQVSDIVGGPQELNKLMSAFNFIMMSK